MTAHCEANSSGRAATDWGFDSLPCNTARGLRTLIDRDGIARRFCAAPGHRENVARRFGEQSDEQVRVARAIERISADFTADMDEDEPRDFDREGQPEWNGAWR